MKTSKNKNTKNENTEETETNNDDMPLELSFNDALANYWLEGDNVNGISRMLGQIQHPDVRAALADLIASRVSDKGLCLFNEVTSLIKIGNSNALVKLRRAGVNIANASALRQQLDSDKSGGFKLPPSGKSKSIVAELDL